MLCFVAPTSIPQNLQHLLPSRPRCAAADTSKNRGHLTTERAFRRYAGDKQIKMKDMVDQSLGFRADLQLAIEKAMTAVQRSNEGDAV